MHHTETNHKEYEGNMRCKIVYPQAEKILIKFNENCKLRSGAGVLISGDQDGRNPEMIVVESLIKKE